MYSLSLILHMTAREDLPDAKYIKLLPHTSKPWLKYFINAIIINVWTNHAETQCEALFSENAGLVWIELNVKLPPDVCGALKGESKSVWGTGRPHLLHPHPQPGPLFPDDVWDSISLGVPQQYDSRALTLSHNGDWWDGSSALHFVYY